MSRRYGRKLQRYGLTDALADKLHLPASRVLRKQATSDSVLNRAEFGPDDVRRPPAAGASRTEHLRHHPTLYTTRPSHLRSADSVSDSAPVLGSRSRTLKMGAASTHKSTGYGVTPRP